MPMSMRILFSLLVALFLAACAAPGDRYDRYGYAGYAGGGSSIGVVERIDRVRTTGEVTGAGAVIGGVAGGLLGSQIGSGSGRTAATVAGTIGGAAAGHAIERDRVHDAYELAIRTEDGRRLIIHQRDLHGIREGTRVRILDGVARRL
jgi:outer membrane lipoprotein SlyB